MQSPTRLVCPRCHEGNLPFLSACAHCGMPFRASVPPQPPAPDAQAAASDLPPLMWALACFFLALWGLVAAGPLAGAAWLLMHPYLLLASALVPLIITGIYLAEKAAKEPPKQALVSARDLMALSWTAAALLGAGQAVKLLLPVMPAITRYEFVRGVGDGCRVEVYLKGDEGDELWRLTGLNRRSEKEVVGVIVRRPGGGSARLPLTQHTPQGECAITKYHLMVNGKETDHVDGVGS